MTDATQPTTYEATTRIAATPDAVFDAITTVEGLQAWWIPRTEGSGATGGELRFNMGPPNPLIVRVDAAVRPTSVEWTVAEGSFHDEWVGTRPVFTITDLGDGTSEVHFRHGGLTTELECHDSCSRSWDHFVLTSLREYLELGAGSPQGSPKDLAWRAAVEAT